jgi:hypothetical protein
MTDNELFAGIVLIPFGAAAAGLLVAVCALVLVEFVGVTSLYWIVGLSAAIMSGIRRLVRVLAVAIED